MILLVLFLQTQLPDLQTIPQNRRVAVMNEISGGQIFDTAFLCYEKAEEAFKPIDQITGDSIDEGVEVSRLSRDLSELFCSISWCASDAKLIGDWIAANQKTLDHLQRGTNETRAYWPVRSSDNRISNAELLKPRALQFGKLLLAKAALFANEGKWESAWEWNGRAMRLAEHAYTSPLAMPQWTGAYVERLASRQAIFFAQQFLPHDMPRWLRDIRDREKFSCPPEIAAFAENVWSYDWLERCFAWAGGKKDEEIEDYFTYSLELDPSKGPKVEDHRKGAREAFRITTLDALWPQHKKLGIVLGSWLKRPLHEAWAKREKMKAELQAIRDATPALKALQTVDLDLSLFIVPGNTCNQRRGLALVLAILESERKNTKLPDSLDHVKKAAPDVEIVDLLSGQPFGYRVASDGKSFTLYSVGWDQKDDGGKVHTDSFDDSGDFVFWPPR